MTIDEVMALVGELADSTEGAQELVKQIRAAVEELAKSRQWEKLTDEEIGVIYREHMIYRKDAENCGVPSWYGFTDAFQEALIRKNGCEESDG